MLFRSRWNRASGGSSSHSSTTSRRVRTAHSPPNGRAGSQAAPAAAGGPRPPVRGWPRPALAALPRALLQPRREEVEGRAGPEEHQPGEQDSAQQHPGGKQAPQPARPRLGSFRQGLQAGSAQQTGRMLGDAFPAEAPPAFRTAADRFARLVIPAALMNRVRQVSSALHSPWLRESPPRRPDRASGPPRASMKSGRP